MYLMHRIFKEELTTSASPKPLDRFTPIYHPVHRDYIGGITNKAEIAV
jgi:hypothetical protein